MFGRRSEDPVDEAVRAVRRVDFIPADQVACAGADEPLPIGHGQTISQPSLVVEMTRELAVTRRSRVLEIGTGSGFQAAILAHLAAEVFTIERIPELADAARDRLERLGYRNIRFRIGDGALGWPEAAPFDAIIVTAAPKEIPPALIDQLAVNGRMVIPAGPTAQQQSLWLITKAADGTITERQLFGVRFVPLVSPS